MLNPEQHQWWPCTCHPDDNSPIPCARQGPYSECVRVASKRQIGGDHYKDMAIQPIEYILANGLPFIEGAVIKYASRWRRKGGVDDLRKAIHMLELLIEHENGPR